MKSELAVDGMKCKMCAARAEKAAVKAGATSVEVQLESKRVIVEHECDINAIAAAISEAGYKAEPVK